MVDDIDHNEINNDEHNHTFLEIRVVDYYCTFNYLLQYIEVDFPDRNTSCYCPFHDNTNTKAAKLFTDEHDEHLFCFAENKLYKPHHLLTRGIVPFSLNHVFSAIWQSLSDSEKNIFSSDLRHYDIGPDFSNIYNKYKKCELDYFDLLSILKNSQ